MTLKLAFDTSALVSLGHTDLIDMIMENYSIIITEKILTELKEIAKYKDKDGEAAKIWIQNINDLKIMDCKRQKAGEDELFNLCMKENIPMVIDDIKATKKFDAKIEWIFSVHIVFLLYYKKIISEEKAIFSIEKMISERSWKNNIISIAGKMLFE